MGRECVVEGSGDSQDTGMLYRTWRKFGGILNPLRDLGYAQAKFSISADGLVVSMDAYAYAEIDTAGIFAGDEETSTSTSKGSATCTDESGKCVWRSNDLPQGAHDMKEQTATHVTASMSGFGTDTLVVNVEVQALALRPSAGPLSIDVGADFHGIGISFDLTDFLEGEDQSNVLYGTKSGAKQFTCKCKK
jgi:hypothetical protein